VPSRRKNSKFPGQGHDLPANSERSASIDAAIVEPYQTILTKPFDLGRCISANFDLLFIEPTQLGGDEGVWVGILPTQTPPPSP